MSPVVMGIVNVTPDSFSDGGHHLEAPAAVAHGRRLVAEGADIVDIGGESTRPGAQPVPEDEELRRVVPVVEALADETEVSIDTSKAAVAVAALRAGATIVNDVSASLHHVAAEHGAGWVAMHCRGEPRTMQRHPRYEDVVAEVQHHLEERAEVGRAAGVERVWIDPGVGFGKTLRHNLQLLAHLDRLVGTGWPVAVGTSRKSSLGALLGASDHRGRYQPGEGPGPVVAGTREVPPAPTDDRLEGSLATATWALAQGVDLIRVHDVAPTVQALRVVTADPEEESS